MTIDDTCRVITNFGSCRCTGWNELCMITSISELYDSLSLNFRNDCVWLKPALHSQPCLPVVVLLTYKCLLKISRVKFGCCCGETECMIYLMERYEDTQLFYFHLYVCCLFRLTAQQLEANVQVWSISIFLCWRYSLNLRFSLTSCIFFCRNFKDVL